MSNISVKINFDAIDQAKLFPGKKGRYFDIVLIATPNGQYGDYMAVQGVSKEERAAGVKGAILGNGKSFGNTYAEPRQQRAPARDAQQADDGDPWS